MKFKPCNTEVPINRDRQPTTLINYIRALRPLQSNRKKKKKKLTTIQLGIIFLQRTIKNLLENS